MLLGSWRVSLARPALATALEPALAALARGEEPPAATLVKRSRVREVLRLPLADGTDAYLKWSRRESSYRVRSSAAAEYRNLCRVREAGVAAVEPLAVAERRVGLRREALLVTRAAAGAGSVDQALRHLDRAARQALLAAAAVLARRLHDARLWHRDLHPGNLLRSGSELLLVDLQKLVALPFALPVALRARDLVWLVSDGRLGTTATPREIASAYIGAAPGGPELESFVQRLARAAQRAARTRLEGRGRRCITTSTGFRSERRGRQRVLRRADVTTSVALAAAGRATAAAPQRIDSVVGGPPPGPAADLFGRGQGGAEAGAPATAPAFARPFSGGPGLAEPLSLAHPGLRAWRLSHALLLRGLDTPAPLALVETRRLGWVSRSVLLTRCVDDSVPLAEGLAARPEWARRVGAEIARLHGHGVELAGSGLALRRESAALVALRPEGAHLYATLPAARAARDLDSISRVLAPSAREALHTGYREAALS